MSQRTTPPFRADHVGSLLRTPALRQAREKRARGEITADAFKEIEDREVKGVMGKQEAAGLKSITDGEYRGISWNIDFLERLDNVESYTGEHKIKFQTGGAQPQPIQLRVIGKLGGHKPHPTVHFKFLRAHTAGTSKIPIPSPSSLHFRYGRDAVPESLYPAMGGFYRDLGTYRKVVRAFADAGCRYLQLDEVNLAYLCDPSLRKVISDRGEDSEALPPIYAGMINAAIADIPPGMTITMHLCRGNFCSNFVATGGYEPAAELLFNTINVHGYFMEYDTERPGGFYPLRFVPKNKTVVLGLLTTKSGALENKDAIKRRIEQATKFIDLDRLRLSPQCDFTSTEECNVLAEHEQWAKLRAIVEIADEIWS